MCVNRANQCKISGSVRMSSSWFHASIKYIYILNTAHGCDVTAAAAATSIHSAICYRPSDIFMYSYMYTLNKAIFSYSHFILPSNWFYMSFNWCDRLADAKPSGTLSIASFIYCAFCVFFFSWLRSATITTILDQFWTVKRFAFEFIFTNSFQIFFM